MGYDGGFESKADRLAQRMEQMVLEEFEAGDESEEEEEGSSGSDGWVGVSLAAAEEDPAWDSTLVA